MAEATKGNRGFITELDIRTFLRDYPATNKLIGDYEFSEEEIRAAKTLVVDKWNDTPPFINSFTVDTFPFRWAYIMGTSANLLTMAAMKFRRNHLAYNVPGGAVDDQNKAQDYDRAAAQLGAEFNAWMMKTKVSINLSQCWGSDTMYYGYDIRWW